MQPAIENLPDDPIRLKQIIIDFQEKIGLLEEHIRLLRNEIFGRKSEKPTAAQDDRQRVLFDEVDPGADAPEIPSNVETAGSIEIPAHKRGKVGRKPLPENLPRIEVIHDLDDSQKQCACGCQLTRIGEEVCEKLDIIPASVRVIRHIRYKYACKGCEGVESQAPTVQLAPAPAQLIPKSMATVIPADWRAWILSLAMP